MIRCSPIAASFAVLAILAVGLVLIARWQVLVGTLAQGPRMGMGGDAGRCLYRIPDYPHAAAAAFIPFQPQRDADGPGRDLCVCHRAHLLPTLFICAVTPAAARCRRRPMLLIMLGLLVRVPLYYEANPPLKPLQRTYEILLPHQADIRRKDTVFLKGEYAGELGIISACKSRRY